MKPIHLLCCALSMAGCLTLALAEEAPPPDFSALIKRLSSDDFEERTAAHRSLQQAGLSAENVLRQAAKVSDAEVQLRVALLLEPIDRENTRIAEGRWLKDNLGSVFGAETFGPRPVANAAADGQRAIGYSDAMQSILQWLASTQEEDGHYDSVKHGAKQNADIEQTALALLAFLSAGHTEKVGQFKPNTQRAIAWLITQMRDDGAIVRVNEEPNGLTHAVAAMALAEAYGMVGRRGGATGEAAQKALAYSVNSHRTTEGDGKGGFGRTMKSKTPDLLTTAFYTMQLKSAKVAGLEVPAGTFEELLLFLDARRDPKTKRFSLAPGLPASSMATVWGCLALYFTGSKREDLQETVVPALVEYAGRDAATGDALAEWAGRMLALQQGEAVWRAYQGVADRRIAVQESEGGLKGSLPPSGAWCDSGRVFSTAVGALLFSITMRYRMLSP